MIIRVDGHEIPVLTEADLADEDRAAFANPVSAQIDASGYLEARLPGSNEKATMYDVNASDMAMDFTLVRPPGGEIPMSLSSLRPMRVEGRENPQADALHQVRLFHAVGSVTVAGGHVEMAMRKVLVSLRGGENEDLAGTEMPAEWSRLHAELEDLCADESTELKRSVKNLLGQAESAGMRETRNHIVHGYWWLIPMSERLYCARYFHPKSGLAPTNSRPKAEELQKFAGELFAFAAQLEALVTPEWPLAIVPALGDYRGTGPSGDIELHERLDDQTTKSTDLRVSKSTKPKPGQKPMAARKKGDGRRKRR